MQLSLTTSGLLDPKRLDSWVPEKRRAIRKAVEAAMKTTGREMADAARSRMQSAFKVRKAGFLKSMRAKVLAGSPERFPALLIGSKIAWLGLHMKGGTITGKRGKLLIPLPATRYEFAEWKVARVGIDYHVEVIGHYYSVPYRFAREKVDVRLTASIVELFHRGARIASHARCDRRGHHSTLDAHMAPAHQAVQGWNAPRLIHWAGRIGPHVQAVVEHILNQRRHPQQGFRACLGILRLGQSFGDDRLEAACERAIAIGAPSYGSLKSILKHGLDRKRASAPAQANLPLAHANVRGPDYYH